MDEWKQALGWEQAFNRTQAQIMADIAAVFGGHSDLSSISGRKAVLEHAERMHAYYMREIEKLEFKRCQLQLEANEAAEFAEWKVSKESAVNHG